MSDLFPWNKFYPGIDLLQMLNKSFSFGEIRTLPYLSNLISILSNNNAGELIGFLVSLICGILLIFISW